MASRRPMAAFIGLGFEIFGLALGAAWLGRVLDGKFAAAHGLITPALIILAFILWAMHIYQLLASTNEKPKDPS